MKAIITARLADWHICFEGRKGIWACGKTPEEAIREFKRTAASHDLPTEFEVEYDTDRHTQAALADPSIVGDPKCVREAQEIHLLAACAMTGRRLPRLYYGD